MRWGLLLPLLIVGCSASEGPGPTGDGFDVVVRYDSTMSVKTLAVAAVAPDGTEVWARAEFEAPLFLDPPGTRQVNLRFDRPTAQRLNIIVDGLSEAGAVTGSGNTDVVLAELADQVEVRLGAPVTCGDGERSGRETCDDGGRAPSDGCSALCQVEAGWTCTGVPSRCGRCGDGVVGLEELCDDGNTLDGDGCSSTCTLEVETRPFVLEVEALAAQKTAEPEWVSVDGSSLTIPAASDGDRWVIFVSGTLGSDDIEQISAQAALRMDGQVVEQFGHQTMGGQDNDAGFVTFHVVEGDAPVVADLAFSAAVGVTTISQVRVVALRVPPSAYAQWSLLTEQIEIRGIDQELSVLSVEIPEDGQYLVMARGNLAEAPGDDTARMWLVTPEGRVPWDEDGVSFSSSRDARVPFFVQRTLDLREGDTQFELRGTSSGSGALGNWWDERYPFRRQVTVTAGPSEVPQGYPVAVEFAHEALVAAGRSQADGRDVRFVYSQEGRHRELTRVLDPERQWGAADTKVWVQIGASIPPQETHADLWMYFGAQQPDTPPNDPGDVFSFFDALDGTELAAHWDLQGGDLQTSGGYTTVGPSGRLAMSLGANQNLGPAILEARLRFETPPQMGLSAYLSTGRTADAARGTPTFMTRDAAHAYGFSTDFVEYQPMTPDAFHTYGIALAAVGQATFYQDEQVVGTASLETFAGGLQGMSVTNASNTRIKYDWVRIRPWLAIEPTVSLEPITGPGGLRPSRFAGLSILAIKTSAFAEYFSATEDSIVQTTETATLTLVSLEIPPSEAPKAQLVIMSTRVAGESSEDRRRVGMCLANGQALLQTSHIINRDAADVTGYHHIAGVVDARTTDEPVLYETAIRSPEGLQVQGAFSSVSVIRF